MAGGYKNGFKPKRPRPGSRQQRDKSLSDRFIGAMRRRSPIGRKLSTGLEKKRNPRKGKDY